jgi:hypothetical protein
MVKHELLKGTFRLTKVSVTPPRIGRSQPVMQSSTRDILGRRFEG